MTELTDAAAAEFALARLPRSRFGDFVNRHLAGFMLAPAAIVLLLLTVYPVVLLFAMAVSHITFAQAGEVWAFTPLANVQELLHDEVFRVALWNTLIFAVLAVGVEMVLGLALAILVASIKSFKGIMRTVLIVPILMPAVAIGSMWKLMYSLDFGVFNQAITSLGLSAMNWTGSLSLALYSIIVVDIWHWTPFVFLILFAAVEGLPGEVLEAARIDGARNADLVFKIIIPLLRPALTVALLFRTIIAFKVFDEVFLLTSGGPGTATEVVGLRLYEVFFRENDMGYGATLSLAVIAATAAVLWTGRRAAAWGR